MEQSGHGREFLKIILSPTHHDAPEMRDGNIFLLKCSWCLETNISIITNLHIFVICQPCVHGEVNGIGFRRFRVTGDACEVWMTGDACEVWMTGDACEVWMTHLAIWLMVNFNQFD